MKATTINGFQYPLHLACEDYNEIQPAKTRVYFEGGYAYASDCMVLVKVALTDALSICRGDLSMLERRSISASNFKTLYKAKEQVELTPEGFLLGEVLYKTREEPRTPMGYEVVVRDLLREPLEATERVRIKPALVNTAGKIIDPRGEGFVWEFRGALRPVVLKPGEAGLDAVALVMPMALK